MNMTSQEITLKNTYQINTYFVMGTDFIEVCGLSFNCDDLYKLVGKDQFMTTFILKNESRASNEYGHSITGLIFYNKDELAGYEMQRDNSTLDSSEEKVKIHAMLPDLTQKQHEELKYGGLFARDIESISFMTYKYKRVEEYHDSGEKVVPNIIYITSGNDSDVDFDILYQNYIVSKINHETKLIPFEKEKFIGITLAINDGHIDSRLLDYLGYDIGKVQDCHNIWYHLYQCKKRRQIISEEEMSKLADLEFIRWCENIKTLFPEITASGVNADELLKSSSLFEVIKSAMKDFEPNILLHGKKQVFWDLQSYLHIVLRHVKQLQIGHFKNKTTFPYKFKDLELLIEQVLKVVDGEIKRHFEEKPDKDFSRHGKMCVLYNGDYYCIRIDGQGRLETFYAT